MRVETSITLSRLEQPSQAAWKRLQRFAGEWNRTHVHRFSETMGVLLDLKIPDSTHAEMPEITEALRRLEAEFGIQAIVVPQRIYDADDYANADFVSVFGAGLDEAPGRKLVVNAHEVLTLEPCPRCGCGTPFDQVQSGPLAIREALLDRLTSEGAPPPPGGWDFVTLESGHTLVSARFAAFLTDQHVEGYTLEPILGRGGQPSNRAWQLFARRAVVTPCPEHTVIVDGSFCPVCGVAQCTVVGDTWMSDASIGGDDIVARHRLRGTFLHISGRVYRALVAAGLQRIRPGDVFRVCRHG